MTEKGYCVNKNLVTLRQSFWERLLNDPEYSLPCYMSTQLFAFGPRCCECEANLGGVSRARAKAVDHGKSGYGELIPQFRKRAILG